MIFLWVPETKQRTLEELDYICAFIIPITPSENMEIELMSDL